MCGCNSGRVTPRDTSDPVGLSREARLDASASSAVTSDRADGPLLDAYSGAVASAVDRVAPAVATSAPRGRVGRVVVAAASVPDRVSLSPPMGIC